jgi:hypothetical protein
MNMDCFLDFSPARAQESIFNMMMFCSYALAGLETKIDTLPYFILCHAIGLHPMLVSYALAGLLTL